MKTKKHLTWISISVFILLIQFLTLANADAQTVSDIVIDDSGAQFIGTGWSTGATPGFWGLGYRFHGPGTGATYAEFRPNITTTGDYEVYTWYVKGCNRTTVPYVISDSKGTTTVMVNQTANDQQWFRLGRFSFVAGSTGHIRITDNFGGICACCQPGHQLVLMADAVKLVYVTPSVKGHVACVCDGTTPVVGATVQFGNESRKTDSTGYYSFSGISSGNYLTTVSQNQYFSTNTQTSISTVPSVKDFVLKPQVLDDSILNAIAPPASVKPLPPPRKGAIVVEFTPHTGETLAVAACKLGFDHFNWINIVKEDPHYDIFSNVLPYLDPPHLKRKLLIWEPNVIEIDVDGTILHEAADDLPFYQNDGNAYGFLYYTNKVDPSGHSKYFYDQPVNAEGGTLAFQTHLVGVRTNGSYAMLRMFEWKSTYRGPIGYAGSQFRCSFLALEGGEGDIEDINTNKTPADVPSNAIDLLTEGGGSFPIVLQPSSQNITPGNTIELTISSNNASSPMNYQWRKNRTDLLGATNVTLKLTNISINDAGEYDVILSDANGSLGSTISILTVTCPTIMLSNLTNATAGLAYTNNLIVSGGTAPHTFIIADGHLPPGLTLSTNGVLVGAPTTSGTYDFVISATDIYGCIGNQSYTLTVDCPVISTGSTLSNATVGVPYNQNIIPTGGTAPYVTTITTGNLPSGLALSTNGFLSGIANTTGNYTFSITFSDAHGCAEIQNCAINVVSTIITVTPAALPNGTSGVSYNQNISANGGTALRTFTVINGALPPGLSLSSGGILSGTPGTPGNYNFLVTATDAQGFGGSRSYTLIITCPVLTITPLALPFATNSANYLQTFGGNGGIAPYNFSILNGALPSGLSLSSSGILSGTPSASGSFTIGTTDSHNCVGSRSYTLTVINPSIEITPLMFPTAAVGNNYSIPLSASHGNAPYTFAVYSGKLPPGITLSANGTLSGTPTVAGTFGFVVMATDATPLSQMVTCSLQVFPRPTVAINAPKASQRITNNFTFLLNGIARAGTGGPGVTQVFYKLNGGDFQLATGASNWSASINLTAGTNTVEVKAVDVTGKESIIVRRTFFEVYTSPLSLSFTGLGAIKSTVGALGTPTNGSMLEVGRPYTITAIPGPDNIVSNWTGTVEYTNLTKLTFVMQSNFVLQVNFVPNPFIPAKGLYNGLFFETNVPPGVAHQSAGFFALKLTTNSSFSGKFALDGDSISVGGKFHVNGTFNKILPRRSIGKSDLQLSMKLNPSHHALSGSLSDGTWTNDLHADLAIYSKTNPFSVTSTNYTLLLPGAIDAATAPPGYSYMTMAISSNGQIKAAGSMADGHIFSQSVPISENARWPFYVQLYKSERIYTNLLKTTNLATPILAVNKSYYRGSALGWLTFNPMPTNEISWIKTSWTNAFYPAGFTNQMAAQSSIYTNPPNGTRALDLETGLLILTDGNLNTALSRNFTNSLKNVLTVTPTNHLMKLSLTAGSLNGTFRHPDNTNKVTTIRGVILQSQKMGGGYFQGTNQTGKLLLNGN